MFESIYGLYIHLTAATMASYGHGRGVSAFVKKAKNFETKMVSKKRN